MSEDNKMVSIKEKAESYEGAEFLKIEDFEQISVELDIEEVTRQTKDGEEFIVNEAIIEGKTVRVPNSVLAQLQEQLKANPKLIYFKVSKKGEGLNTSYTVIPLPSGAEEEKVE